MTWPQDTGVLVVPAHVGTHNHRRLLKEKGFATLRNDRTGLATSYAHAGVPAFAGTTS